MNMREIKFRAWDNVNKIMLDDVTTGTITICDKGNKSYSKDCIFMQYTGLQDKTGRDIFEGDIIEAYEFIQKPKMVVRFDEEMAGFIPFIWKQGLEYQDYIGYFAHENWCIVIGNIYENPELLDK